MLAETKLSNRGIGFLVIQAYSIFNMPQMYSLLIILFVISIGANELIGRLGGLAQHPARLTVQTFAIARTSRGNRSSTVTRRWVTPWSWQ